MTETINAALAAQVASLAAAAGLNVQGSEAAVSFAGDPTLRFQLSLAADPSRATQLELSQSFDASRKEFQPQLTSFFFEAAKRSRNPRPNTLLTLSGLPLSYTQFAWPFHSSTAGADTSLVHGQINLEDGEVSVLHAKIAGAMTVTFREVVLAPEQPFAESFILNAVRKTMDQGQIELVKSGNRQPVPVTTRFYSARTGQFVFNDTTEPQRRAYLAAKTFWLSGTLGASAPVWLLDPRDAQYLNTTVANLKTSAETLVGEGLIRLAPDAEYASPTSALMAKRTSYQAEIAQALAFIKPTFNEEMRSGHTNM